MMLTRKTIGLSFVALAVLGLAACGKDDKPAGATQVAAKVNSTEISVHQVNFVLQRSGVQTQTPEQAAAVKKAALERLVDQQLAVDQAVEKKLDRQPDVVLALELARREVLARAFAESVASGLTKPSEDEAKKYYADNPALFKERRVYNLQEIIVSANAGVTKDIKDMVAAGKSMDDIAGFLKGKNVQAAGGAAQRAAEQIPLEVLPKIAAIKDGQTVVLENGQAVTVVRVAASAAQPVSEAQALPRIVQFLATQRNNEAVQKEMKQLREKAKVTYSGEFAAATAPAAAPAAAPSVTAPAGNAGAPAGTTDSSIEKGLKGLK